MAKVTKSYKAPHRRRAEKRTDYRRRLALIKSGKPRVVIRKSSSHMRVQLIEYSPSGDRTIASATSQELKKHGWACGTGNLPAAYLTGLLAGTKAKGKVKEAVLDIGVQISTKGSRLYAALKGVLDAGIKVPHDAEILPKDERIRGGHIAAWSAKAAKPSFSKHDAKEITKNFDETKAKITGAVG
ncbi:MAG: 50S ribosomal protein L18 [Candidatus Aenigmatarchaeota archaeon]